MYQLNCLFTPIHFNPALPTKCTNFSERKTRELKKNPITLLKRIMILTLPAAPLCKSRTVIEKGKFMLKN